MLKALPGATVFHTANWADVLARSYNYLPTYLSIFKSSELVAVLPMMDVDSILTGRRGVGLPFTDQCGLLSIKDEYHKLLIDAAVVHGEKVGWKYLELRQQTHELQNHLNHSQYYLHLLQLQNHDKPLLKRFRSSTVRNIKKSEKEGIATRISNSYSDLCAFYKLNCNTRKDHSLPPQPFKFFKHLYDRLISKDLGFIAISEYEGQKIAACVYLHFNGQAVYKYGASDRRYQSMRANNHIMWRAIEWYADHGYDALSFGRTDEHHDGLRQFKRGWDTDETLLKYYRYQFKEQSYEKSTESAKDYSIFGKLPIPLLKVIGRALYRHVG